MYFLSPQNVIFLGVPHCNSAMAHMGEQFTRLVIFLGGCAIDTKAICRRLMRLFFRARNILDYKSTKTTERVLLLQHSTLHAITFDLIFMLTAEACYLFFRFYF